MRSIIKNIIILLNRKGHKMLFLTAHTNEILAYLVISILFICGAIYYFAYKFLKKHTKDKRLQYIIPLVIVIVLLIVIPFTREFISYFLFNRISIRIPNHIIF